MSREEFYFQVTSMWGPREKTFIDKMIVFK